MVLNIVDKIDDLVKIRYILASVSDKKGLDKLIPDMIEINPDIKIFSTGGTYKKLEEIIGKNAEKHLIRVSDYTKQPETQGGLVKTLDFKIYLGLLTETYNKEHIRDIERTKSVQIDMVICNLYPFENTISKECVTTEEARSNIDIGGPCMIRAAAKNYLRTACVVSPDDYEYIIEQLRHNKGCSSLQSRLYLAGKAFRHVAEYDRIIADFMTTRSFDQVRRCYSFTND